MPEDHCGDVLPENATERDRWILERRPARSLLNENEPYGYFTETERSSSGEIIPVSTILLTNRECPFRCVMCDLWRNTLTETVSQGSIAKQIRFALKKLPPAHAIKLYNSGSFFDPRAIPYEDYPEIAGCLRNFERVVVECHPRFVGERCLDFRAMLPGQLEIAMGLETANPDVLEKLNKRMTLKQFAAAANYLRINGIDLRVFVLVQPPFMRKEEALDWTRRSIDFAFDCGAIAVTLLSTRDGNGAMESLAAMDDFAAPSLSIVERSLGYGISLTRGRVFADLWDLRNTSECVRCFDARVNRLRDMNLQQRITETVFCDQCQEHD